MGDLEILRSEVPYFKVPQTMRGEGCLIGYRNGERYEVRDDQWVMDFYYGCRNDDPRDIARAVVRNTDMWGDELASLPGFEEAAAACLERIEAAGMAQAMKECLS